MPGVRTSLPEGMHRVNNNRRVTRRSSCATGAFPHMPPSSHIGVNVMEWGLVQLDPVTHEPLADAEEFDGDLLTIEDLDLMLIGTIDGPVKDLCFGRVHALPSIVDPKTGEPDRGCAAGIIDCEDVVQCAERVAGISREKFAAYELAIELASHAVDDDQGPDYYRWLTEATEQFQRFIASAARRGAALKFWVAG